MSALDQLEKALTVDCERCGLAWHAGQLAELELAGRVMLCCPPCREKFSKLTRALARRIGRFLKANVQGGGHA